MHPQPVELLFHAPSYSPRTGRQIRLLECTSHSAWLLPLGTLLSSGPVATTGREWWLVSWNSSDYKTRYCSAPNKFRASLDSIKQVSGPGLFSAVTVA